MDFSNWLTDLKTEPITGWLPDGRYIDIPLISHIEDNLYVGGYLDNVDLGDHFTHVFSLYKWGQYVVGEDTEHNIYTMYDDPRGVKIQDIDENDLSLVDVLSDIVAALNAGGNVLIHCQAGINRSNLLAALALRAWKGITSSQAIELLREKRSPLVLANRAFVQFLLGMDDSDEPNWLGVDKPYA